MRARLTSLLTILCAALGLTGALTAVNYASSGRQEILMQIEKLGTHVVTVSAKQSRAVAGRERTGSIVTTLDEADYRAIEKELLGDVPSSAIVTNPQRLKAGFLSKSGLVSGVEPAFFQMKSWNLLHGNYFGPSDVKRTARVALIGYNIARDLFENSNPVGERLFINRVPFEVIGVLEERGSGLDNTNEDDRVYIPLSSAMRRLGNLDYYDALLFEIPDIKDIPAAESVITDLMRQRNRSSANRPDDFQVQSQRELIDTQLAAADQLGLMVTAIGIGSIVMAGLGILATAWIGVRNRIMEIGTRRAIGATSNDIFWQFSCEAFSLSLFGVALGVGFGWVLSDWISQWNNLPHTVNATATIIAVMVAIGLNLLFAALPALRAAQLDPIRALQTR